ncbi:AMIN-like domain-containing (lipo)protein [Corynebacterium alimapuense]|uniref:AMIN-like domain-containing protein n=1 Tax=Corynebacterium alimapuense TaxID=1576874 RepID=A0A3M8K805_9CORY|nr:hypothetical protein [Corynebacterium alimapuense]RNE49361.1 hypothetical protein C5L39_03065 [Corynebacterium alimapuense]
MSTLTHLHRLSAVGALAAGSLVLSACTSVDDGRDGTASAANSAPSSVAPLTVTSTAAPAPLPSASATDTLSETTTSATSASDASALGEASLAGKQNSSEGASDWMVTGVRVGSHEGFDRVVFDLSGTGTPGWNTYYTDNPIQQASGFPVEVDGEIALKVAIFYTPYPNEESADEMADETTAGAGVINEVVYSSLFEARSEYVIGMDRVLPYSVTFLEDPARLVIDFVAE